MLGAPSKLLVRVIVAGVLAQLLGRRKIARWLLCPGTAALLVISALATGQRLLGRGLSGP